MLLVTEFMRERFLSAVPLADGQEPERSADSQPQAARRANAVRQCPSYFRKQSVLLVEEGGFFAVADFEVAVEDFELEGAEGLAVDGV